MATPGFMRIPMCSAERKTRQARGAAITNLFDIPPVKNTCADSPFKDQRIDASPLIEVRKTIIRNIEGDGNTDWMTQVVGKPHRKIASHASCAFGIQATKVDGNFNFLVGGPDFIDNINDPIARFACQGKIGAKGSVKYDGNLKSQLIK